MPKYVRFAIAAAVGLGLQFLIVGTAVGRTHIVASGESLSVIAGMYDVTVGQLVDVNDVTDPDVIFPGQELHVPGGGSSGREGTSVAAPSVYVVRAGDTLSGIAEKFDVTTAELQAANGIEDPDYIHVGQELSVPGSSPAAAARPASGGLSLANKPANPELEAAFDEIAAYHGVDAGLVKALAWVESGWQQHIVSPTGAVGVMQLMPGTTAWLEADMFGQNLDEGGSAYHNIQLGTAYLAILMRATGGNEKVAVGSYYQGHGNTMSGVLYGETVDYIGAVFAVRDAYWP
jgi:LysM repeat protein